MCHDKNYDVLSLLISILAGIGFAIIAFINFITSFLIAPWIAIGLAGFSLLVLTIVGSSLLRQDPSIDKCVRQCGKRLLVAALALFAGSVISILFALTNLLILVVLVFLVATFFVYTVISLYSFLTCVLKDQNCQK